MARAVLGAVDTLAIRLPPGGTPQSHQAFFFLFFPPVLVFFFSLCNPSLPWIVKPRGFAGKGSRNEPQRLRGDKMQAHELLILGA